MLHRRRFAAVALLAAAFTGMPSAQAHTYAALVVDGRWHAGVASGDAMTIVYSCEATGAGDVVSIALTCALSGSDGTAMAFGGPVAVVAGVDTLPLGPFAVCYTAVFTFTDAHTKSVSGCGTAGFAVQS